MTDVRLYGGPADGSVHVVADGVIPPGEIRVINSPAVVPLLTEPESDPLDDVFAIDIHPEPYFLCRRATGEWGYLYGPDWAKLAPQ